MKHYVFPKCKPYQRTKRENSRAPSLCRDDYKNDEENDSKYHQEQTRLHSREFLENEDKTDLEKVTVINHVKV